MNMTHNGSAQKLQKEFGSLQKENQNQDKYRSPIRPNTKPLTNLNVVTKGNLGDPSWEVIDPTPDVYALFMAFDVRFFWGSLKSVVVRWSKRMYKCAGTCSYQGRGGLCTVSLSEPLLKLRPRKDLVETLLECMSRSFNYFTNYSALEILLSYGMSPDIEILFELNILFIRKHEMIHAYLFLTNNNRDRDGHGPEFHKHMYRINKEAGVNISVYHSFHDEVKMYQTHWWRCTGVCRSRAPFFGLIKRTCNRAPGANDFWWKQHSMTCNGKFEKIKEPEKKVAKSIKNIKKTSSGNKTTTNGVPPKWNPSSSNQSTITSFVKNTKTSTITRPVNSVTNAVIKRPTVTGNLVNVKGFKDLNTETDLPATSRPSAFSGAGFSLGGNVANKDRSNLLTNTTADVRNHWANKFPGSAKKRVSDIHDSGSNKRQKINDSKEINISTSNNLNNRNTSSDLIDSIYLSDSENDIDVSLKNKSVTSIVEEVFKPVEVLVNCPVCTKITPEISINKHLDECMSNLLIDEEQNVQIIETKKDVIIIDDDEELVTEFNGDDSLIEDFMNKSSDSTKTKKVPVIDSNQNTTPEDLLNCPLCNVGITRKDLADHFDSCISDDFTTSYVNQETSLADQTSALKAAGYTDQEIQECVKNIKLENATSSSSPSVIKDLKKSIKDLDNSYFNESVNASFVGSQTVEVDDDDESYLGDLTQDDVPNYFSCPKCSILISLEEMNFHLDKCLNY